MKPLLFIVLVALGTASCGPVSIRDNNFGDLTAVGLNLAANVQGDFNANIANVILALLVNLPDRQPPPTVGPPMPPLPTTTAAPVGPTVHPPPVTPPITPPVTTVEPLPPNPLPPVPFEELVRDIEKVRSMAGNLSQEQKDQLWREHVEPILKKMEVYQY